MFLKNTRTAKDMGYVAIFTLKQVGNSSKSVVAAYENGKEDGKKEIEAKLHEMEAQLKVKEKALKQAEAKIAKLESEAEAKNKA